MASLFFALVLVSGCDSLESGRQTRQAGLNVDRAAGDGGVVAEVDGRPITATALRAALADEGPDAEVRNVLDRLITQEVLFGHALTRPLSGLDEVRAVARARAVQRLVEDRFEARTNAADVPEEVLEAAYERNVGIYNHPDLMDMIHLLVVLDEAVAPDAPERRSAAALAEALRREILAMETSKRSFTALKAVAATHKAQGRAVRAEDLSWRARSSRLVPAFLEAAFLLKVDGAVSSVVETRFGYHVIVRRGWRDALKQTYAEVRPDVLERVHPDWRHREFMAWVEALSEERALEIDPGPLVHLQQTLASTAP